ncbi:MAG: hypothetical protein ACO2PM_15980 [Pyrobaculum sp.]
MAHRGAYGRGGLRRGVQAEKLGVNETTLRYLGAVASGAIDGDR